MLILHRPMQLTLASPAKSEAFFRVDPPDLDFLAEWD